MKNKFLSLNWFLDKLNLQVKEKKVEEQKKEETQEKVEKELYKTIKLINTSLTVVLHDGTILSKPNATENEYNMILNAPTIAEIKRIMTGKEIYTPPPVVVE